MSNDDNEKTSLEMENQSSCKPKPACSFGIIAIPGICPNCGGDVKIEMKKCPTCNQILG